MALEDPIIYGFSVLCVDPVEYGVGMFFAMLSLGCGVASSQKGLQDCSSSDQQKSGSASVVRFFCGMRPVDRRGSRNGKLQRPKCLLRQGFPCAWLHAVEEKEQKAGLWSSDCLSDLSLRAGLRDFRIFSQPVLCQAEKAAFYEHLKVRVFSLFVKGCCFPSLSGRAPVAARRLTELVGLLLPDVQGINCLAASDLTLMIGFKNTSSRFKEMQSLATGLSRRYHWTVVSLPVFQETYEHFCSGLNSRYFRRYQRRLSNTTKGWKTRI